MSRKVFSVVLLLLITFALVQPIFGTGSTLYPWLTDYSFYGVASWAQPLMASGAALPSVGNANTGEFFVDLATAGAPTLWRKGASVWEFMSGASSGGGGGSGVATHSLLAGLDYASSGHTGFLASASLLDLVGTSTFNAHAAKQSDPHGATMSVSVTLTVGSGTEDCSVYRYATGTIGIATYAYLTPTTATPPAVAEGVLWMDSTSHKLKCYDGSTWQSAW